MNENDDGKRLVKKMLPKVLKATLGSIIIFLLVYLVPSLLIPEGFLPSEYQLSMYAFATITVVFFVLVELASGTIFQYAFSFLRALVLIVFFIFTLGHGIITVKIETFHIVVNLTVFLAILILVELLGMTKSVLGAVHFLSEKVEE